MTSRTRPSHPLLRAHPAVVLERVRGCHAGTVGSLGRDHRRRQRPGHSPHGLGQDPRRVPVVDRQLLTGDPVDPKRRLRVLYVSPLKALAVDIERNLRTPLAGITAAADRMGATAPEVSVGFALVTRRRTSAGASRPPARHPDHHAGVVVPVADVARPRAASLRRDRNRRRGAHDRAQQARSASGAQPRTARRVARTSAAALGLSATVRPPEEVATFLGGGARSLSSIRAATSTSTSPSSCQSRTWRTRGIGSTPQARPRRRRGFRGRSACPRSPRRRPSCRSGTQRVAPRRGGLLDLIEAHSSTIVFVNSRRLAERLCRGSTSWPTTESERERGDRGPDRGSGSPRLGVARAAGADRGGLQGRPAAGGGCHQLARARHRHGVGGPRGAGRISVFGRIGAAARGRAGHQVGEVSRGVFFPKFRGDLLETSVVVERMHQGAIEEMHYPRNPLDVLAQQVVAMVAMDDWTVDDLETAVRAPLPSRASAQRLEATLDMLSGRYPSHEFAELRPASQLGPPDGRAYRAAGSAAPCGDVRWHHPGSGDCSGSSWRPRRARVSESSTRRWSTSPDPATLRSRCVDLAHRGNQPRSRARHAGPGGRRQDAVLARRRSRSAHRARSRYRRVRARDDRLQRGPERDVGSNPRGSTISRPATSFSTSAEQKDATGNMPDDRTIVVERFRDEIGDWRVCVHSFFGAHVHAPWAQAIEARVRERTRPRRSMHLHGRRHRRPSAGGRRGSTGSLRDFRSRGDNRDRHLRRSGTRLCSRAVSGSARRGPCCCRAGARGPGRRCGNSASGARISCRWRANTSPSP